ncbi:nuclear transport factor 2-like [Bidens hawaiensis]|uniref:nuclear transport factor 2-like n=1 Tax=Bidens hawaiensis TaxID=980011 RepID=UPI00404BA20D
MEQITLNETKPLSSQDVAKAFVKQYYYVLQKLPQKARNFYKDQSIRCHPRADGSMKSVQTRMDIHDEIMAQNVVQWIPDLDTLYAQGSEMESVIVGVSGALIDNNDVERNFVQTFVLVPQEGGGFYVHNDVLQLIDGVTIPATRSPLDDVASILTAQHIHDTEKEDTLETENATNKDRTDKSTSKNMVAESSKGKNIVTFEPKKNSQSSLWKSVEKMQEEAKQVSYASVLFAKDQGSEQPEKLTTASPTVPKPSVSPNIRPPQNIYDGKTVCVKNLPPTMTQESLLQIMKHFGPVKHRNIHIKAYPEDGYCYAFVEFDHPKAASNAVEARFICFADRYSEIQYKKFPNQGGQNYAGRPPYGQGGYGNANFRGRDGEGRGGGS